MAKQSVEFRQRLKEKSDSDPMLQKAKRTPYHERGKLAIETMARQSMEHKERQGIETNYESERREMIKVAERVDRDKGR